MWLDYFLMGLENTGNVLAAICGGAAAVVMAALVLAVVLLTIAAALGAVFNMITDAMARRWEKTGKRPANRWAEIIERGRHREE